MITKEKHPSEYDRRTKVYKTWKAEQDNEIKIEIKGTEDLTEERLKMAISDNVPQDLLKEIMTLVDCNCVIQAYDRFHDTAFPVTVKMQNALNNTYYEFFKERIRRTSCSSCIKRRINRIRQHLITLIDG